MRGDCRRCGLDALPGGDLCDLCAELEASDLAMRRREWRRLARIPRALAEVCFDDVDLAGPTVDDARAWGNGHLRGLVLAGAVGVGKTHLAAAAANARLERGPLRWASTPALLAQALASDAEKQRALEVLCGTRGALVLDDLDKAGASDWARSQVFLAIDTAVSNGKPLLVTTNAAADELAAKFGEAVASRLLGYCTAHRLAGSDRRLAGHAIGRAA